LLAGIQADQNDYSYLKDSLQINSNLYVRPSTESDISAEELVVASGRRIPIVSVHDGEAGLLDNLGSIVGVKQISCAVRKHSKCGRPSEIYAYHGIDAEAVVEACGKVLSETALEKVVVKESAWQEAAQHNSTATHWTELWPSKATAAQRH